MSPSFRSRPQAGHRATCKDEKAFRHHRTSHELGWICRVARDFQDLGLHQAGRPRRHTSVPPSARRHPPGEGAGARPPVFDAECLIDGFLAPLTMATKRRPAEHGRGHGQTVGSGWGGNRARRARGGAISPAWGSSAQCIATYVFRGGQITGQALIRLGDPAPYAVAITGGSGRYEGVEGETGSTPPQKPNRGDPRARRAGVAQAGFFTPEMVLGLGASGRGGAGGHPGPFRRRGSRRGRRAG
jgi:hypothetical protein